MGDPLVHLELHASRVDLLHAMLSALETTRRSGAVQAGQWDGGSIKQVAMPSSAGNALTTTYPPLSMTLYVVG